MAEVFVPFGAFDPGKEHGSGMVRVENVLPAWGGLRSFPKHSDGDDVAAERFTSVFFDNTGQNLYIGALGNLYHVNIATGVITDISGAAYGALGYPWSFAVFGADVWAVNAVDPPQRRTGGAGAFANGVTSTFVPLPRCAAVVREYMVVGALNQAGRFADEFAWSDAGDATWFDDKTGTRATSFAGSKRILTQSGGGITAILGGQYGVIWKERSMHALQFTGGDDIWRLDEISETVGTEFPASIVLCADGVRRFWGGTSFYEQQGLQPPAPLGGDEISSLLLDSAAHINGNSFKGLAVGNSLADYNTIIFGVEDRNLGIVYWFYVGANDTTSTGANRGVAYNYRTGQWTQLAFSSPLLNLTCGCTSFSRVTGLNKHGKALVCRLDATTGNGVFSTFDSTTNHAITLATQRFALGQGEQSTLFQKFHLNAIQPVMTMNQSTFSTDYKLETIPSTLAIRAIVANEPNFQAQTDELGTQISPRSESRTMADANANGWLGYALEGRSLLIELTVPESTTTIRGFPGVWIDYDLI